MKWYFYLVVPILINIAAAFRSYKEKPAKRSVCASRRTRIIALASSAATAISFIVLAAARHEGRLWAIVLGLLALTVLFLVIIFSQRIDYTKDGFTVKKFIGRSKTYSYEQIDGYIICRGGGYKLDINGRKILLDPVMEGNDEFLNYAIARNKYKLEEDIPIILPSLFHGYFLNPGELLFAFLVAPVIITALGVFLIVNEARYSVPQEATERLNFQVTEYRIVNKIGLEMQTEYGRLDVYLDAINDAELLFREMDERELLTASVYDRTPQKDDPQVYDVWGLSDSKGKYLYGRRDCRRGK